MGIRQWLGDDSTGAKAEARKAKFEGKAQRARVKEAAKAERDAGVAEDSAAYWATMVKEAADAEREKAERDKGELFEGVTLKLGRVQYKGQGGSVVGATARVESGADVRGRITATRLLAIGVFALAAMKQTGHVYLTVEAPGFEFVVELPVEQEADARVFAAKINNTAKQSA